MSIVLTLDPLFFPLPNNWLRGELWSPASGNTRVKVDWPNFPAFLIPKNADAHTGMMNFDDALHEYAAEDIIGYGHSAGGQIIYKWLREKAPTAGSYADPDKVRFICTGNPERKYNGASVVSPDKFPAVYPGLTAHNGGCPTPIEHHGGYGIGYGLPAGGIDYLLTDFVRQYDGWGDAPNRSDSPEANRNAQIGRSMAIHGNYRFVSLTAPSNKTLVEGNVTYMITSPTTPVPILNGLELRTEFQRCRDRTKRAQIERAYTRPYRVDAPDYQ